MASRIEDYALIGDCETAALISKGGSIDWLCLPRFDSPACFAALLGTPEHGRWQPPVGPAKQTARRYVKDSLVLETDFESAEGAITIVDFMPLREKYPHLVRMVRGVRGEVDMEMEFILRFDYGELIPWVTRLGDGGLCGIAGAHMVVLRSPTIRGEGWKTISQFKVKAGESLPFVLCHVPSHRPVPEKIDPNLALSETLRFWKEWIGDALTKVLMQNQ